MPYDWNDNPDFYLLFLPRSGSHMLVSALNSHPQIDCSHSDQGHSGDGDVKGHAQCCVTGDIKKAIVLTRNSKDRMDSFFTDLAEKTGDNHVYKPGVKTQRKYAEKCENRYLSQKKKGEYFLTLAEKIPDILVLKYEDLTKDKDIREIPEKYARQICDFLDVSQLPLTTKLYKPEVVNARS